MKDTNKSDCLVIEAMQNGSEEAFTILYRKYSLQLYINVFKIVHDPLHSEEIVQEVFTKIWENRAAKGIADDFLGYTYRISQNLIHDFFRKVKRDKKLFDKFRSSCQQSYEPIEESINEGRSNSILERAIEQLSPQQKKVYSLVKIEGCTYKKAAKIMGISPFTVKEYLVITKKSLQSFLLKNLDINAILLLIGIKMWL